MPIIGWCLSLSSDIGPLTCVILSGRNHGFVRPFHNAARFRPSTRQAGLRNSPPLPQGPVRIVFRIPQPPSPPGRGRTGPQFFASKPLHPAGSSPAFLFEEQMTEDRRQNEELAKLSSVLGGPSSVY